jgi:hypothetical protein
MDGSKLGKRPCVITVEKVLEDDAIIDAEQGAPVLAGEDCKVIS